MAEQQNQFLARDIPGAPDYRVSDNGHVFSTKRGTLRGLVAHINPGNGYREVTLCVNGVKEQHRVHRLVLRTFVGEPSPDKPVSRHLNGDPLDNRLENLRWGTVAENSADDKRNGVAATGERHGCARLTESTVLEIKRLIAQGILTDPEIAARFSVSQSAIWHIAQKKHWRDVPDPPGFEEMRMHPQRRGHSGRPQQLEA